jgi:hypothetical protein
MTTHRDLTTPEEVLAALRAGERVEFRFGAADSWCVELGDEEHVLRWIGMNVGDERDIQYRAPAKTPRPRTFTAAEVAEAMRDLMPAFATASTHGAPARAAGWNDCRDELHERITHWLRESEG